MSLIEEKLSAQFYAWERRGRGWQVYPEPVCPEPPFEPFYGHFLPEEPLIDDGRRPNALSSFTKWVGRKLSKEAAPATPQTEEEPEPELLSREALVELQTFLPANLNIKRDNFEQFLSGLSLCREPVTFEILGRSDRISAQFAVHQEDEPLVDRQLRAFFPDAVFLSRKGMLETAWQETPDADSAIVEFGLAREFMLPLGTGRLDPFVGIVGALTNLLQDDLGLFQVIFMPARAPWAENMLRSVTDNDGKPFFVNVPELVSAAKDKAAQRLYAAVVRIAARSPDSGNAWEIVRHLASSLGVFNRPGGNELVPLVNDEYPLDLHELDVLRRQSRRSGMLLSSEELIGFVHLPSTDVRSAKLERQIGRTKPAPPAVRHAVGLVLGENVHAGDSTSVTLTPEQRVRHIHVIGGSGTGKSTLLYNLIRQDIEGGAGVAVLDPHGDLVDRLLGIIPDNRVDEVVLLDPGDEDYSTSFNILSAHSDLEKNLLASDLVSLFQRLSGSWGDQMGSVLNNAILAFLESSRGGTLSDLRRFLLEPGFRNEFLETVQDPDVVYYWRKGFSQLSGNKSVGPVLTRLETFLSRKTIRYMVSQRANRLDFADILDSGKIFLAKLPQGTIGRENSYLLGTLLVSKFQQLAMSRQRQAAASRRDYWIYIDEFHNFITPSMAEILSGARKYRVGLVLAHEDLHQLQRDSDVSSAVIANPGTRICFRVGDDDARKLADGFSFFEAKDLQTLGTGQAICRVERSDFDFNLSVPLPEEPPEEEAAARREAVIAASRKKYAVPRAEIEATARLAVEPERPRDKPVPKSVAADGPPAQSPRPVIVQVPAAPVPPSRPAVAERKAPATPPDLGRGGAQHQAIQQRIKKAAEKLGFRSTIEKEILEGQGSVDVLLERADQTVACEISLTTTTDHEVGNVAKCLKAGLRNVVVICVEAERLRKIATAVAGSLGESAAALVQYYQPDQFIAHLEALPSPEMKAEARPKKRRGYTIKRSAAELSPEEQKQREEAAIRSIAEAMRRKGK